MVEVRHQVGRARKEGTLSIVVRTGGDGTAGDEQKLGTHHLFGNTE